MGLRIGFGISKSRYDRPVEYQPLVQPIVDRNPDPYNFKIKKHVAFGKFLVIMVNYPNCSNYEGDKILVYQNVSLANLKIQGSIDPHFSNNSKRFSPIARFVPTDAGWRMAESLALAMSQLNKKTN